MYQPETPQRSTAKIIWQQGALYGAAIGVLLIIISFIPLGGLGTLLNLVVWLGGFFVTGWQASKLTGKVGTGALTGLVAGLVSGILTFIVGIITSLSNTAQLNQLINQAAQQAHVTPDAARAAVIFGIIIGLVLYLGLQIGLGAGLGALGGILGKSQARIPPPPQYPEQPYQPPLS